MEVDDLPEPGPALLSAIVEDVGPDCPPGLVPGQRVAVWPIVACGSCHACQIGRDNACERIGLRGDDRCQEDAEREPEGGSDANCEQSASPAGARKMASSTNGLPRVWRTRTLGRAQDPEIERADRGGRPTRCREGSHGRKPYTQREHRRDSRLCQCVRCHLQMLGALQLDVNELDTKNVDRLGARQRRETPTVIGDRVII